MRTSWPDSALPGSPVAGSPRLHRSEIRGDVTKCLKAMASGEGRPNEAAAPPAYRQFSSLNTTIMGPHLLSNGSASAFSNLLVDKACRKDALPAGARGMTPSEPSSGHARGLVEYLPYLFQERVRQNRLAKKVDAPSWHR